MLIYWARLFDYSTYWTNFQNNYLFVHCHVLGKIIQLLYVVGTTVHCAIIGKYCWIIFEERLQWLEPWQVSLGGEHYLFPEPHYFMNISITNLILLCDPSSSVLPCIHCCSGCPTLRAISESEGICQWAEGKTFSGQVKVLTLITSLKLGSNADLDFHKITLPLLTPELNISSSMSPMHVSPQVSSVVFCDAASEGDMRLGGRRRAESAAWRGGFGSLPQRPCQCSSLKRPSILPQSQLCHQRK